jgi:transcriptional regulator with XRE-family HTH domain
MAAMTASSAKPPRSPAPLLGPRLKAIRRTRNLSLDDLAALSGVSKSMLSQVERGQANPTFATLWSLTTALDLELPELIGLQSSVSHPGIELMAGGFTPEIRTDDGLCTLRILSPTDSAGQIEWYDLALQPGGALVSSAHARGAREHLTVREGVLQVASGGDSVEVNQDATARYAADVPHAIRNLGRQTARALLVVAHGR